MPTILQLTERLAEAKAAVKTAEKAHKTPTAASRLLLLGAIVATIDTASALAKADKGAAATMKKVTEKYSEKKERLEESDEEEESVPPTESSKPESSAESSAASSEEEEEEEEEEESAAMPSEEEEEEESAVAKGWAAANKAYKAATKGTDAYAIHGPKALLAAVQKSTKEASILGTFGALAAAPHKAKAEADMAKRVGKIESETRDQKIEAIVAQAKTEGRAPTKQLRAELRTMGKTQGVKALRGFVAALVPLRTPADGERQPKVDAEGNLVGAPGVEAQEGMLEKAMAGLSGKERAEFLALWKEKSKVLNGKADHS